MNSIISVTKTTLKIAGIVWLVGFLILSLVQGEIYWEKVKILSYLVFCYGTPMLLASSYFLQSLSKSVSWKTQTKERFWKGLIGSILVSMLTLFVVNFIQWIVIWGANFGDLFTERNIIFYMIGLILAVVVSTFIHIRQSLLYKS